jgi:hypothetical protein
MLDRFKNSWFPGAIAMMGLMVVLMAFSYDSLFTTAPPGPEAPIELAIQFHRRHQFLNRLYTGGVLLLIVGLPLCSIQFLLNKSASKPVKPPVVEDHS